MVDIDDVHDRAIRMWIQIYHQRPTDNPSHGIFFTITDQIFPAGIPDPTNVVDLCDVFNQFYGVPPLTDEDRKRLRFRGIQLLKEFDAGRSPYQRFLLLARANWVAYGLGIVSMFVRGFSWLVLGLLVAVFWCFGAARTATRMAAQERRPQWELPAIATMHVVALAALLIVAIARLVP